MVLAGLAGGEVVVTAHPRDPIAGEGRRLAAWGEAAEGDEEPAVGQILAGVAVAVEGVGQLARRSPSLAFVAAEDEVGILGAGVLAEQQAISLPSGERMKPGSQR